MAKAKVTTRSASKAARPTKAGSAKPAPSAARERGPRADALRNRASLLAAAREVFRERGLAAQMDDVAARAGLGVGTLYRHFPTKEALLDVMVRERHRLILDEARTALKSADPWERFASVVWRLAEMEAEDRAIADVLIGAQGRVDPGPFYAELSKTVRSLTRRAQAAGAMRKDVSAEDALLAVCTIGRAQPQPAPGGAAGRSVGDADAWRRLVRIILDGMRPPDGRRRARVTT
ncbi:MAG TPA: helix-turn-helix domain-containing protein [Chloroflexota bacterium]|nr:helix-turn-helix domain-containing protein [Chloroflexota bacterium]